MKARRLAHRLVGVLAVAALQPAPARGQELPDTPATPEQIEFFESRVRPVLADHCYRCHSTDAKELMSGLRVDSRAGLLRGGERGPAIDAKNLAASRLVAAIEWQNQDLQMPPDAPLADAVRADLKKWVEMGAPWPDAGAEDSARVGDAEIDFDAEREKHWAWKPVSKPDVPVVAPELGEVRNEIDRFVLAKIAEKGLHPSPEASPHTLVRRLYLDLLGLPPTPEQVRDFVEGRVLWEDLVDQLLDSHHHGERWGRHWLDVARYSTGFGGFLDRGRYTNAWRYRDWTVAAFNDDMPYDQFLRLQIAGDLIDPKTHAVATGLFALGPTYQSDGGDPTSNAMAQIETLDDRVDTLGRGLLGLTVGCARCHDHKFDPIPTLDYYSIAGVFKNSALQEHALVPQAEVDAWKNAVNKVNEYKKLTDQMIQRRADAHAEAALSRLPEYMRASVECMAAEPRPNDGQRISLGRERGLAGAIFRFAAPFFARAETDPAIPALKPWFQTRSAEDATAFLEFVLAHPEDPQVKVLRQKYFKYDRNQMVDDVGADFAALIQQRRKTHDQMRKDQPPKYPTAHALRDSGNQDMKVALRGNLLTLGEEAPRRFLRLLDPTARLFEKGSGRLELAESIARADNPLTARVFVNRLWGWHFGKGIVTTPSNFGQLGARPSHPELLDWLAATFVERGWSIKEVHRLIVNSATWRQSSQFDANCFEIDGDNAFLWRMNPRKLEVEAWRDSILAITGELAVEIGGAPYDDPAASFRRTLYARTSRNGDQFKADHFLRTFDYPLPRASVAKRITTITPQQSLFLLNNPFVVARSKALAARLSKVTEVDERIATAYELLYARAPRPQELETGKRFLAAAPENDASLPLSRLARYSQALLAANEFLFVE